MTNIEDGFRKVLADFKRKLSPEEEKKFRLTSLNDLKISILDLQEQQKKSKTARNLTRIQPFLQAMAQYQGIIEVFLNTSEILCFVWGPLKFILLIANNMSKAFDTILETYAELADTFPLISKYREMFQNNDHVKQVLVWVYEDILKFHLSAWRVFSQPAWKKIFNSAWRDFQTTTKPILSNLSRHGDLLGRVANVHHIEEARDLGQDLIQQVLLSRSQASAEFSKLLQNMEVERLRMVTSWLATTDVSDDQAYFTLKRKNDVKSGRWLLDEAKVAKWLDPAHSNIPLLWINGKPGAVLIEEAIFRSEKAGYFVFYFYCKESDPRKNKFVEVAKSFIWQILRRQPSFLTYLYDECVRSGQPKLSSEHDCGEILSTLLEQLMKQPEKVYLILDGLDECEKKDRKAMLKFFVRQIDKHEEDEPGKMRGALVSQELPDIKNALHRSETIQLTKESTRRDKENYTKHMIGKLKAKFPRLTEYDRTFISEHAVEDSDGMFLFTKLVLKNLLYQENMSGLQKELEPGTFPHGFEQAYARIVKRIFEVQNPVRQRMARRILGWITCARRPLSWREIRSASAIDVNKGVVNFDTQDLTSEIREICGSLVDILPGDRVQLVHATARQYLFDTKNIIEQREERSLSLLCLQYLNFDCFEADLCDSQLQDFLSNGTYAFSEYAMVHWSDHLFSATESLNKEELSNHLPFGTAINTFLELLDPEPLKQDDFYTTLNEKCGGLMGSDCFETLLWLLTSNKARRLASDRLDGLGHHGDILGKVRNLLQVLASTSTNGLQSISSYYGENIFKCPWHACYYFHEGFKKEAQLLQHINRHEKPWCCTELGCTRELIGWATEKEFKRHMSHVHPDPESLSFKFPHVKKLPSVYKCETCSKQFARQSVLTTHVSRVHLKEKKHECETCKKRFTTKSDRDRHNLVHGYSNSTRSSQAADSPTVL